MRPRFLLSALYQSISILRICMKFSALSSLYAASARPEKQKIGVTEIAGIRLNLVLH
jgi:hypothetical protein